MVKYETIKELDEERFRRLTGVKRSTFNKMVEILRKANKQKKANVELPHRKIKKKPLDKEKKKENQELASQRVVVENVIGSLKRFKVIADRYRRKRFGLRFNLIAGIYNLEL